MKMKLTNLTKEYTIWQSNKPLVMKQGEEYTISKKQSAWLLKHGIAVEADYVEVVEVPVVKETTKKKSKKNKWSDNKVSEPVVEVEPEVVIEEEVQ